MRVAQGKKSSFKPSLAPLLSVEDFRTSDIRVAYLQALLRDPAFAEVLSVLRNFCCANIACTGTPTLESTAYDLGRAHGRTELFSVLISMSQPVVKHEEAEQDYNVPADETQSNL